MNAMLPLFAGAACCSRDRIANILAAGRTLAAYLAKSRTLDRKLVSSTMTMSFGASDAEGAWSWKDAYDAVEAAVVLQVRRLGPQVGRVEDAPAEIAVLLAGLAELTPTHTRRSEEQIARDQFSTPPELAAVVVAAAQVRPGDRVLEPSAGTGLIAVVAEACGAEVSLNEQAAGRAGLLDGLFPSAARTRHDAALLPDLLPGSGGFHAVVCNPPFQVLDAHLHAALACLADGGRLADAQIAGDRRFSIALTVSVPLSLRGLPGRPERFAEIEGRVREAARPRGAAGPAGRALEAARLITCAVRAPSREEAADFACRAVDVAIDAEVLAASLQGRDLIAARATAERRALDILNAGLRRR